MIIPSLKRFETDDLNLLYVDGSKQWANAPAVTRYADIATAIADEVESRGETAPEDEVRAGRIDHLKARVRP